MTRFWIFTGLLAALAPLSAADDTPAPRAIRVYELRTYKANPGKLDALHKRFREQTCGLLKKHGIELVGFWTPQDEKDGKADTLIYLLAHASREAAEASAKAFLDDPAWKEARDASEKDGKLVSKTESVLLDPTDYSPDPLAASAPSGGAARSFELRTYIASPGKLADLNTRFREHTVALFRKHGLTSLVYGVPREAAQGHENTLVYLLAAPSRDAAKASWKAFGADPEWQAVYKASQADGIPLAGKVISVFLEPTDYSPIK